MWWGIHFYRKSQAKQAPAAPVASGDSVGAVAA
jgi:hypothetical protein